MHDFVEEDIIVLQLNRVKVVEGERNELEAAKLEAEEYLAMQKDIATKQRSLYQKYM